MKTCTDMWKILGYETTECCDSCHEDAYHGYAYLADLDLPGGEIGYVCCAVLRAWDKEAPLPQEASET